MINLNDLSAIQALDAHDYIARINAIPAALQGGWVLGLSLPLPDLSAVRRILICAVGDDAFSADVLAAYLAPHCPTPLVVHRDYDLPAWAGGDETLVIVLSHSGDTEEALSAHGQAEQRGCPVLVMTTGGRLAAQAGAGRATLWKYDSTGQPRTAASFQFALLLAALFRLGWAGDPQTDLEEAAQTMQAVQSNLLPEALLARNPAKRLAGQLVDRLVLVFGADLLAPVARRFKCQVAGTAKAWGQFEFIPEMNHNSLAGLNQPEHLLTQTIALFLISPLNHPRNQARLNLTRQVFMTQGVNTDTITGKGRGALAQIWSAALFVDYTAYYLAIAYGEDPSQVGILDAYQEALDHLPDGS